jgi:hypothetical protein
MMPPAGSLVSGMARVRGLDIHAWLHSSDWRPRSRSIGATPHRAGSETLIRFSSTPLQAGIAGRVRQSVPSAEGVPPESMTDLGSLAPAVRQARARVVTRILQPGQPTAFDTVDGRILTGPRPRCCVIQRGRKRRQVEAVRAGVVIRQGAAVTVWPVCQIGGAGVDLDDLVGLSLPAQPPPLVAVPRRGSECDVATIMPGHQLTTEPAALQSAIQCRRRQDRQSDAIDGGNGPAANVGPRGWDIGHRAIQSGKGAP